MVCKRLLLCSFGKEGVEEKRKKIKPAMYLVYGNHQCVYNHMCWIDTTTTNNNDNNNAAPLQIM